MRRHHTTHVTDSNRHHAITAAISCAVTALVLVVLPIGAAAQQRVPAGWDDPVVDARCEQDVRNLGVWLDAVAHHASTDTQHSESAQTRETSGGTHSALAAHLAADCPEVGQVLDAVEGLPADGQAEAMAAWMPRAVAACGCEVDLNALKVVALSATTTPPVEPSRSVVASRTQRGGEDSEPECRTTVTPNGTRSIR